SVLHILADNPKLSSLRQDMLPYLTQHQFRIRSNQAAAAGGGHASSGGAAAGGGGGGQLPAAPSGGGAGSAAVSGGGAGGAGGGGGGAAGGGAGALHKSLSSEVEADGASDLRFPLSPEVPGADYMAMAHGPATPAPPESLLRVQLVGPEDAYCARVQDVQAYGEVNREVADPGVALKLSGLKPGRHDNIVPASCTLGNKATVAAACILGEGCAVGDKSSIKRSVLGSGCRLGANVKVINSVLMDGVALGDGAHVQNSVLCAGVVVQAGATLKDCQVGAGFSVAGGVEYKDGASDLRFPLSPEVPGADYMAMAHGPATPAPPESLLRVQLVGPEDAYCARVQDVQAYGEVNREVADPGVALKLSGLKPGRHDNIVPASCTLGNKATVAAACILGEGCAVGDKSSIKRSVLGSGCRLGANVKVINSVLMDGVALGDGAHVQNSVLCAGVVVQAGATLKDCQVGAGFSVAGGVEYKGEILATKPK
ncbi:Translation initiation factor eIF-2B subunit gamma, partial [Tetrabaena socialis]